MSSFNESVGLGYLKTNAIEFVKYPPKWPLCRFFQFNFPLKQLTPISRVNVFSTLVKPDSGTVRLKTHRLGAFQVT